MAMLENTGEQSPQAMSVCEDLMSQREEYTEALETW